MSTQSYNSTSYNGYVITNDKTGIKPGFPLRDSSDYTKMLKERAIYKENTAGNMASVLLYQSNQYNLSHAFGRVDCVGCTGGPLLYDRVV